MVSKVAARENHMKNYTKHLYLGPIPREHGVWAAACALSKCSLRTFKASQVILKCTQDKEPLIEGSHVAAET